MIHWLTLPTRDHSPLVPKGRATFVPIVNPHTGVKNTRPSLPRHCGIFNNRKPHPLGIAQNRTHSGAPAQLCLRIRGPTRRGPQANPPVFSSPVFQLEYTDLRIQQPYGLCFGDPDSATGHPERGSGPPALPDRTSWGLPCTSSTHSAGNHPIWPRELPSQKPPSPMLRTVKKGN